MKIAVVVRQLDRGHILWCGRVVRVERAHGIRVVRGVLKMLDVGKHGVIEFGHIWFVAHDHVVTYVFRKDEFVGCCVAHHSARDIESLGKVWPSRSMSPARVTQQRRQNRRIVWDDRARMGAAVICELEVSQLGYVRMRMGRVSSIGHSVHAGIIELRASDLQISDGAQVEGNVMAQNVTVCGRVKGTIRADRVKLQNGGVVEGDIFHRTLSIDENSQFEGSSRRVENPTEPSSSIDAKDPQKSP